METCRTQTQPILLTENRSKVQTTGITPVWTQKSGHKTRAERTQDAWGRRSKTTPEGAERWSGEKGFLSPHRRRDSTFGGWDLDLGEQGTDGGGSLC